MISITGRVPITIAGEERVLAVDMAAADAFFESVGEHWLAWMVGLFIGNPERQKNADTGKDEVRFSTPTLPPAVLMQTLHCLLAGDREARGYSETLPELRSKVDPFTLTEVQTAITKAVIASLGVPGKEVSVAVRAAADAPKPKRRAGTGTSI